MPDLEYLIPTRRIKRRAVVTINNTSSYATVNPHVQLIKISHYALEYILGIGLEPNAIPFFTYFYDPNQNSLVYSWYDNFDGTYHYWWVKMGQVSANSTYNLYLIYDPTTIQLDGNYVGINPYYAYYVRGLLSTYGQYDNGTNVFYYYWNFAGTTLPGGWTANLNGGSYSVNNGLTITTSSSASGNLGMMYNLSTIPSTGVWARAWYTVNTCCGCSSGNDFARELGNSFSAPWSGNGYAYSIYGSGGSSAFISSVSSGSLSGIASTSVSCSAGKTGYIDFIWLYTNQSYLYQFDTITSTFLSGSSTVWTLSALTQIMVGIFKPSSNSTSYTIYPLIIADAPLGYSIVNNTPTVVPYPTFTPAD